MKKIITSLAELEAEQRRLKDTMELTQKEFARSLGTSKDKLKSFMLKNVALPAGVLGLGAVAAKKVFSTNNNNSETTKAQSAGTGLFGQVFPIALSVVQTYFLKQQKEVIDENIPESEEQFPVDFPDTIPA